MMAAKWRLEVRCDHYSLVLDYDTRDGAYKRLAMVNDHIGKPSGLFLEDSEGWAATVRGDKIESAHIRELG